MEDSVRSRTEMPHGVRLDAAFNELRAAIGDRPLVAADQPKAELVLGQIGKPAGTPIADEWNHRTVAQVIAEECLREGIGSGELGLWVGVDGEWARLRKEEVEGLSHQTFSVGAFVERSDPHNPLLGRPLYLREMDWEAFLLEILESRYGNAALASPPETGGEHVGWIDAFEAVGLVIGDLKARATDELDPAPWIESLPPSFGAERIREAKFEQLAVDAIQQALLDGSLAASFRSDEELVQIPAIAFAKRAVACEAILNGRLEINPLWPEEWQGWNNHPWILAREQFLVWFSAFAMSSIRPRAATPLPLERPTAICSRLPVETARVGLWEAVSFIAFGIALPAERLVRAIRWESFCDGVVVKAQDMLEEALAKLCQAGSDGKVAFFGKFVAAHGIDTALTEPLPPLRLDDFRRGFLGYDLLYFGAGLDNRFSTPKSHAVVGSKRSDHFSGVTVSREDLLRVFPQSETPQHQSQAFRPAASRAPAQGECERWLKSILPSASQRDDKPAFRKEAQRLISGLSGRAFDRAWANVAPAHGRDKAGAKPKLER